MTQKTWLDRVYRQTKSHLASLHDLRDRLLDREDRASIQDAGICVRQIASDYRGLAHGMVHRAVNEYMNCPDDRVVTLLMAEIFEIAPSRPDDLRLLIRMLATLMDTLNWDGLGFIADIPRLEQSRFAYLDGHLSNMLTAVRLSWPGIGKSSSHLLGYVESWARTTSQTE